MSGLQPGFRFASEAQWSVCRFDGADRTSAEARKGLRPFAPYGLPPAILWPGVAHAPAITDEAELLWRDEAGHLLKLQYGDVEPLSLAAPGAIQVARRTVATPGTLWTLGTSGDALALDIERLNTLVDVRLDELAVLDIAWDSRDSVYLLAKGEGSDEVVHLSCAGDVESSFTLDREIEASQLAYLGGTNTIVLLASDGSRLSFLDAASGELTRTLLLASLRVCFSPCVIASDGCTRLFIGGSDGLARGGAHQILLTDEEGNLLGVAPIDGKLTGLVATRSRLFASTLDGLFRFDPADVVPDRWGELRARLVTPSLQSPSQRPQKWMRAEAKVLLPQGCSIEISCGTPTDAADLQEIAAILRRTTLSQLQRTEGWSDRIDVRTSVYRGSASADRGEEILLSAPLHDVASPFIWIEVALNAAPGGSLPHLSELAILYPGPTLIEELPAIYRSHELGAGDFVRSLAGVLEAGTQQLDATIGALGRNINPATAPDTWLDYVASWLGLPWDNGLTTDQKRRLVSRAGDIAGQHGTRGGLEALLDGLISGTPRRFRLVDLTVEHGLATLGSSYGEGSRLPAILGGLPSTASVLCDKAILGKARLPCSNAEGETARLLGHVRVDVAATAEERATLEPWLKNLIGAVIPASAQLDLRWVAANAFSAGLLAQGAMLDEPAQACLGTDAVTGLARLGGRARTTLPARLTRNSTLQ